LLKFFATQKLPAKILPKFTFKSAFNGIGCLPVLPKLPQTLPFFSLVFKILVF
jgi:hypothetical protein